MPTIPEAGGSPACVVGAATVRGKIHKIVKDPKTAEKLMPDHFVMTKRPILENGYWETFNRDNVTLVDLREDPIERFTPTSPSGRGVSARESNLGVCGSTRSPSPGSPTGPQR